ncbi:MAG: 16S rRNA (uracil(1498)-N(3))-methyltransferase [Gammaproteobacteria bacterium]|nr:16S rRNA (uracil(1498)-N(3))-methyltransferase [Gammaproteobacteria bacterium]
MREIRIYHAEALAQKNEAMLSESAARHVIQVLRRKVGDQITLFDGSGLDFIVEIMDIERKSVQVKILSQLQNNNESPLKIHLLQGISKGEHMDLAIQKAVECGVTEITPVMTEFCAFKLDEKRRNKKLHHWQSVIRSACEQAERSVIPRLNSIQNISSLYNIEAEEKFILHPYSDVQLSAASISTSSCVLAIGPEGGFSDSEVKFACEKGWNKFSLGKRILRTETATIAAIAVLQSKYGDY